MTDLSTKNTLPPFPQVRNQIELRWSRPEMAPAVFALVERNRAHLRPWLTWVDKTTKVEHTQQFLQDTALFNEKGQRLSAIIFQGDQVIGSIGYVHINQVDEIGEIGYWLSHHMQGKGIMTDCCKAMITCGFRHLNLNRIFIRAATKNIKSHEIPRRLGFHYEGTKREALKLYDEFHDVELFSLLKKDNQYT